MSGRVLNELVTIINSEVRIAKGKLLVEEGGRDIASLQGHVSGWGQLLNALCAEFGLTQTFIEDLGDEPQKVPDLTDLDVFLLEEEVKEFMACEQWARVTERVDIRTNELKDHLLFSAEKTRDLDVDQGQYLAMQWPHKFFNHVSVVATIRREKQEEEAKRRGEELNFEESA